MTKKWKDIRDKKNLDPEQVEQARRELEREYNRPWWRFVRFYDRIRAKPTKGI